MRLPPAATIRDVTMRDGLQFEEPIATEAKLELLRAIVACGVTEIEATAFVSARRVPALADADEVARELKSIPGVTFSALAASETGVRRALAAGIGRIEFVVSASDAHSVRNTGRTTADAMVALRSAIEIAHATDAQIELIVATAWDCPFQGAVDPKDVVALVRQGVNAGVDLVSLADTIGTSTPVRVTTLIDAVQQELPATVEVGLHLHNTRNTALANAYAALTMGVTRFDAAVGGFGGCPFAPGASGNVATEDLVYLLRDCGVETAIALPGAIEAGHTAARLLGVAAHSALMKAGDR